MDNSTPDKISSHWPLWISLTLGLITALILLLYITRPISSNDLWWHIAQGRYVLESGNLILDHSIFSWTPATPYHTYNAWLGQVFFYLIDQIAGVKGLIAVRLGIFSLIFMLGWSFAVKRAISKHPLTWVIILVSLALVYPSGVIKPELLSLGFMTITVWLYFQIRSIGESARYLVYIFPLILVIWVNTHGGFFLSAPFFAMVAMGELLNRKFSPQLSMPPGLQLHFFIALLLCVIAIFITPYGYEMPFDIVKLVIQNQEEYFLGRISAYRPTYLLNAPPYYLLDYLIIAMLIFISLVWQQIKNGKTDWVVILVFITYCTLFIQMARITYFLGPVFLFIGLDLLAHKENSWAWPNSLTNKSILTAVCISIFALLGWRTISSNSCFRIQDQISQMLDIRSKTISVEAEYIAQNLSGDKIGNLYNDGGYLIYKLWPDKLVMIDPRYFPFENWIKDYFEQFADAKNIAKFIKKYPADYWLIRYEKPKVFQWFFKSAEWELLFLGPKAGIFAPKSTDKIETVISPDITEMHDIWEITNVLISSLKMNNFKLAHTAHEAALNNLNQNCPKHKTFTNEIARTINGYEAFNNGNFKQAAELLSQKSIHFRVYARAVSAYMILAEQEFKSGNYYIARNLIAKAFALLPTKLITDIYNMAVADWHYRHYEKETSHNTNDGLRWQKLIQVIIENKQLIPKDNTVILETAKAMQEGSYDGKGKLLPRHTE